jgi:hypothetical protein
LNFKIFLKLKFITILLKIKKKVSKNNKILRDGSLTFKNAFMVAINSLKPLRLLHNHPRESIMTFSAKKAFVNSQFFFFGGE